MNILSKLEVSENNSKWLLCIEPSSKVKFILKVLRSVSSMIKLACCFRGIPPSTSRESPATLFTVEDEVEKVFNRKKSFFNKKASKSSILTVCWINNEENLIPIIQIFRMREMTVILHRLEPVQAPMKQCLNKLKALW